MQSPDQPPSHFLFFDTVLLFQGRQKWTCSEPFKFLPRKKKSNFATVAVALY